MFGNVSRVPHESLFKVRNYLAWFESWDAIEKTLENSGLLTFSYLAAHVNRYIKKKKTRCSRTNIFSEVAEEAIGQP